MNLLPFVLIRMFFVIGTLLLANKNIAVVPSANSIQAGGSGTTIKSITARPPLFTTPEPMPSAINPPTEIEWDAASKLTGGLTGNVNGGIANSELETRFALSNERSEAGVHAKSQVKSMKPFGPMAKALSAVMLICPAPKLTSNKGMESGPSAMKSCKVGWMTADWVTGPSPDADAL